MITACKAGLWVGRVRAYPAQPLGSLGSEKPHPGCGATGAEELDVPELLLHCGRAPPPRSATVLECGAPRGLRRRVCCRCVPAGIPAGAGWGLTIVLRGEAEMEESVLLARNRPVRVGQGRQPAPPDAAAQPTAPQPGRQSGGACDGVRWLHLFPGGSSCDTSG